MANESANVIKSRHSLYAQSVLAILSGILLSLSFLDATYYFFAWFAFVPFLMAINKASLLRSYFLGFLSGLVFSISTAYWIVNFLILSKGYSFGLSVLWSLVFWLYCAQLSAFIALVFIFLKHRRKVHEFILFPLVIVTVYSAFPMLFTVRLGESQSLFLSAIQSIEFTGVHGLDAIIALSNIMLFRLIGLLFKRPCNDSVLPWLLSSALVIAWFSYGIFAIQDWNLEIESAKTIRLGLVQPNERPSLEESKLYPGFSRAYPPEMAMTERLSAAGAEIIIWPEARYKAYFDKPHVRRAYQAQLKALNVSLVFQDIEQRGMADQASSALQGNTREQFNTVLMINQEGQEQAQYQKMKRIAFGEYVPLVSDIRVLRVWVEGFFGEFLNEMSAGSSHQFFGSEKVNMIPLICYEVMFPQFVASAVSHSLREEQTPSLLVGLSSNGWFGKTRQPYQHVNASILRAVENRMPLVHVVNNGPSVVALPTGELIFMSDYHQAGGYIVDVPYLKSNSTIFNNFPNLFVYSVYLTLLLIAVFLFKRKRTQP